MKFFGFVTPSECKAYADPPAFLPAFSFFELHESSPLPAEPAQIIRAVAELRMDSDPLVRFLLKLRGLMGQDAVSGSGRFGFDSFTLLERSDRTLSLGLVGRFWKLGAGLVSVRDADAFLAFADPGAAKLELRWRTVPDGSGRWILRTETFVYCPSRRVLACFSPYWLTIRPASGWIRRRTLKSITRGLAGNS